MVRTWPATAPQGVDTVCEIVLFCFTVYYHCNASVAVACMRAMFTVACSVRVRMRRFESKEREGGKSRPRQRTSGGRRRRRSERRQAAQLLARARQQRRVRV